MTLSPPGMRLSACVGAALALAAPAGASAALHVGRCDAGGTPLFHQSSVFVERASAVDHDAYVACVTTTGRTRVFQRIATSSGQSGPTIEGFAARGTWLVWVLTSAAASTQRSLNVQTGRQGPVVTVPVTDVISAEDGPVAQSTAGNTLLSNVAITATGHLAWLTTGASPGTQTYIDGLYTSDGHGGDRALDSGPSGSITDLRALGGTVYWRHAGATRSAVIG